VPRGGFAPPEDYPIYEGRKLYAIGAWLLENPQVPECPEPYNIADLAFAKWTGRWRIYQGKVSGVYLGSTIECIQEGYWLKYLRGVV